MQETLNAAMHSARERLARQNLLACDNASLSVRLPGEQAMLFLPAEAHAERRYEFMSVPASMRVTALHADIYRLRPDVGAILVGGGFFAGSLNNFGGALPTLFDEQARHLGIMRATSSAAGMDLREVLREGGNGLLVDALPICLGVNCARMIFNAELLEKCAKAYVLATAAGGSVKPLPWWVRHIANRRLLRDERQAAKRFARGLVPEEARGY